MLEYIVKRLFLFLPTLTVISFLAFGLSKCTPGDPAMPSDDTVGEAAIDQAYRERAELLGLDLPVFYFSLTTAAFPKDLYKVVRADHRDMLRSMIGEHGNWPQVAAYYDQLQHTARALEALPDSLRRSEGSTRARGLLKLLYLNAEGARVRPWLDTLALQAGRGVPQMAEVFGALRAAHAAVLREASPERHWVPALHWYGAHNQYHRWMSRFVRGDFGISYRTGLPVAQLLQAPIRWTLTINALAILLAFGLSILLGVYAAARKGKPFDRWSSTILFMLHSLPNFWVATLLIVFFTTPQYGMNFFPTMGLGNLPETASLWSRFWETAYHLILPVFCVTYGSLAYISRQMRGGMLAVLRQDYIRTARAKGLPEREVLWRHAFRNGLFPLITLFAGIFPAALSGSLVVEVIFSIPGMGQKMVQAIFLQDWPVVYTVLMLGAVLTLVGILVADLLYAVADPRVAYHTKSSEAS